jgi:hypothetical protein
VSLNQDRQSQLARELVKPLENGTVKSRNDQQNNVCADSPSLQDLIFLRDEIFSQQRHRDTFSDVSKVAQSAAKTSLFRQHRDGVCATLDVSLGERGGIVYRCEVALGRTRPLYLGYQPNVSCRRKCLICVNRLWRPQRTTLYLGIRNTFAPRRRVFECACGESLQHD